MGIFKSLTVFFERHMKIAGISFLAFLSLYLLFYHLGYYRLIDVDETRYVGISYAMLKNGDWITPVLNGVPFLEKPPLYYWLNVLSFKMFGISEFSARFMTALLALFSIAVHFLFSRKILNTNYAVITSCILVTSLWFLLFSHVAILDFGFMFFTMAAIYSAVYTLYCAKSENKKYFWWLGYVLMALAVLMKGFIGIIVPSLVVFFVFLARGKVKELFKPVNIFPGLIMFLLVALPWHYLIFKAQGMDWVNMYIIKHHFARFVDSGMGLGRKQPFLFYIPVILCGFLPWTFVFISSLISGIKVIFRETKAAKRIAPVFSSDTNDRRAIVFAGIYFLSVFLFFSLSSTKLPSYILTLFPAVSLMCAYYWWGYLDYDKYKRGVTISVICTALTFLLCGVGAFVITKFFPDVIGIQYLNMAEPFLNYAIIWFIFISVLMTVCLIKNYKRVLFGTFCLFMAGVMYFGTTFIIPMTMNFGQNELEEYTKYARSFNSPRLVTFDFPTKYSVMNKFEDNVDFINEADFELLNDIVLKSKSAKSPVFLIVKNKNFAGYEEKFSKWKKIKTGVKYTLLKN